MEETPPTEPEVGIDNLIEMTRLYAGARATPATPLVYRMQVELEVLRRKFRKKALEDFWFFVSEVVGLTNLYEPFHRPICETAQRMVNQLHLHPRGTMKSWILSDCYALWILLKYPDTRILLISQKLELSKKFLKEQLGVLKKNKRLRFLFPEFVPPAKDLKNFGLSDRWRVITTDRPTEEGSVEIASIDHGVTSRHYELIIFDDLLTGDNSTTAVGLDSVKDCFNQAQALFTDTAEKNPKACPVHWIVIGTHWSYLSLYTELQEKAEKEGSPVAMVTSAYREDGSLACPTMLSEKTLADRKRDMTRGAFSAQFLNKPISEADAMFRYEDLQFYDDSKWTEEERRDFLDHLAVTICYDPAKSLLDSGDDSAIVVSGVDGTGVAYVLEYVSAKMRESEVFNHLFRLWDKWKPYAIYIEDNGIGAKVIAGFEEYQRVQNRYVNVHPIHSPGAKSKEHRIRAQLEPVVNTRRLFIKKDHDKLIDQITKYPRIPHEDLLDALSMTFCDTVWGETSKVIKKADTSALTWASLQDPRKDVDRRREAAVQNRRIRSQVKAWKRGAA